ncbi:MAG: hypothetical protein IIC67_07660 [Thaumarchaeota archaeon]|nr:hypothetical protein [Nitrososphaerota archaeon]
MAIEVNIVNDVIEFIQKDSLTVILLAFSTFALAIITAIALVVTLNRTKKSNDELTKSNIITERMLELTHRPILKLNYVTLWWEYKKDEYCQTYSMLDSSTTTKKFPIEIQFKLTNSGIESAQNIIASYDLDFINNDDEHIDLTPYKNKFTTNRTTIDDLKSKQFDLDLPASYDEEYKINDELEVCPSTKCIFTFEISYNFLGDSEGYIQYIYEYSQKGTKTLFRNHLS